MTNETKVKVVTADPSALGLFGLAIITIVASSQKLGITSGVSLVLPWAIFLGASAQLMASINDFKHNNTDVAATNAELKAIRKAYYADINNKIISQLHKL